jgi:gas vesicle protein
MGLFSRRKHEDNPITQPAKKKGYGGIITGIVVGGAVGSVASLLFAPKKGSETRADVAEKGKELFDEGKTQAEKFLDKYKR